MSHTQLRQITRNQNEAVAEGDMCKSIITRLDRVLEACHLCGGQCITLKAAALFSLGKSQYNVYINYYCCTATAWKLVLGDCETTTESLQEVANKYVESLLTIHPASLAHVGYVSKMISLTIMICVPLLHLV